MRVYLICFLLCTGLFGCKDNSNKQTETSGKIKVLVDESFAPIVDDEVYVFENTYPNADVELVYKPEISLMNTFLADSAKVAIMSRTLEPREAEVFEKKNIKVRTNRFAIDAIALIINARSADTLISVAEIVDIMKGKGNRRLVFDNPNSSTVRYLMSLSDVNVLPVKGVYALNSNEEVIKFVHNNLGSIGVIGVNWIRQPSKELAGIVEGLSVMSVKNLPGKQGSDRYYKPSQDNLAMGLYPLQRDLFIINCQGGSGLGWGLASFLAGEVGQRIVLKSGLLPDSIPPRELFIRDKIEKK